MERDALPQPPLEHAEQLQGADLVVGVLTGGNGHLAGTAAMVREALGKLSPQPRAVLVVNNGEAPSHIEEGALPVLFCRLSNPNVPDASPQKIAGAYQTLFEVSGKIGARTCGIIASQLETVTPQWIDRLVQPVLEKDFDLVAPRYARHKWEGLLNRSILSPLNRALYGKRIQNPLGPDFALSRRLMNQILNDPLAPRRANSELAGFSISSIAASANFQICEARLGARHRPAVEGSNLSSFLAEILGPVFLDMERNASVWQRIRGSQSVPAFGDPEPHPDESIPADVNRLIDSFQLGAKNLHDIWSLVLPPTPLLEIRKLARQPAGQFRLPDDLWVSIVHDFAVAHRVRTINRDHLLRSFTPLYLGWIASYTLEMEGAYPALVDARMERLARAFETGKPYLVSQWRWPDRFNP